MEYYLEVYEATKPGSSDCLEAIESDSPFVAFSAGDTYILYPQAEAIEVTIQKVTHIVWKKDAETRHKVMLYITYPSPER